MTIEVTIPAGILLDWLDAQERKQLYPRMADHDEVLGATTEYHGGDVIFTIGSKDDYHEGEWRAH